MKILLDGYADHNLGDDLMIGLAAYGLKGYDVVTDKTKRADIFLKVIGSGFLIGENKGIPYRIIDMRNEKKYAPLKVVMNCNISPFINSVAERLLIHDMRSCALITVRDEFSYQYIRKNAPKVECVKYPDMVMSIPDSMIPNEMCEDFLGIAVHNSIDAREAAKIADGYIGRTGKGAVLLCFDSGRENDMAAAKKIEKNMKNNVRIVAYNNITDMLAEMKKCAVILCARLHSAILSMRMGIPFVPLSYSDKAAGALAEMGYREEICAANSIKAEEILEKLINVTAFPLDRSIITAACGHIKYFKDYLKRNFEQ